MKKEKRNGHGNFLFCLQKRRLPNQPSCSRSGVLRQNVIVDGLLQENVTFNPAGAAFILASASSRGLICLSLPRARTASCTIELNRHMRLTETGPSPSHEVQRWLNLAAIETQTTSDERPRDHTCCCERRILQPSQVPPGREPGLSPCLPRQWLSVDHAMDQHTRFGRTPDFVGCDTR